MARFTVAGLLWVLALAAAPPTRAAEPDWEKFKEVGTIKIITHDEDGAARETTIWMAVVDGQGFIRTTNTRWVADVQRNPSDVVLRIEGVEYPLRAKFIENEKLRKRVTEAFHAKYGWFDTLSVRKRIRRRNIMHMVAR